MFWRRSVNRTICDVFKEMRTCLKTNNFSYLAGLIEEAQTMANRMEESLYDQHDLRYAKKEYKKLKKEIEKLESKRDGLDDES